MNINDLTIGQAKELAAMFGGASAPIATTAPHPYLGRYVVVRTYSAGVHVGTLAATDGKEVILTGTRRIYQWSGAFTLSAVAQRGITDGKMSLTLPEIALTEAIEIIPASETAQTILVNFKEHTP